MNTDQITNPTVKTAIEALQKGNVKAWIQQFTASPELYDDGDRRNFMEFSTSAVGEEYFTSIDKVENDGKDITGHFHTEKWGNFDTCFKFRVNKDRRISRLDIGQAG